MKTCKYKGCKSTEANEYGYCPKHYFDYSKSRGRGAFDLKKIKNGFKRLSKSAPEPEIDLEETTMAVLLRNKKPEEQR